MRSMKALVGFFAVHERLPTCSVHKSLSDSFFTSEHLMHPALKMKWFALLATSLGKKVLEQSAPGEL